jgi:hypothetical protein
VIGRVLSFAHFAINPGPGALLHQIATSQDQIDAQSAVLGKCEHPIIPPAEEPGLRMKLAKRVGKSEIGDAFQSRAFLIGAHDGAAPKIRVVHVEIARRNVEVAGHDGVGDFFPLSRSRSRANHRNLY